MTLEQIIGESRAHETKKKLAELATGRTHVMSIESKARMSESRIKVLENSPHVEWFDVGGVKVQGGWEKQIAEKLLDHGIKFIRIRLKYDGHRNYTPDFYLPEYDLYLEVKGWLSDRDKEKYTRVLKDHPTLKIFMILGDRGMKEFDVGNLDKIPHMKEFICAGG